MSSAHHSTFALGGVRSSLIEMATCYQCGKSFTRQRNLRRHQISACKGSSERNKASLEVSPLVGDADALLKKGIELAPTAAKKRKLQRSIVSNSYDAMYDDQPLSSNIHFLPETINGLAKRFNELFPKYWATKDVNVHNELVSLLDELLHQHGITREIYKKMNDLLSISIGHGINGEKPTEKDEEEELEEKIIETVKYLVRHDRTEIEELLNSFLVDELFEDDVNRLDQLTQEWIANEILGKQLALDDIEQILRKLKSSSIPRSKLHRFEMILGDIRSNRFRVSDIMHRMNAILSDPNVKPKHILDGLKGMVREGFISDEQFKALNKNINNLDLDKVIAEIKSTKVGRGINFLPRETSDLMKKLKDWTMEFAKNGTAALRQKILSVLDELLFRNVITKEEHKDIKEDSKVDQSN